MSRSTVRAFSVVSAAYALALVVASPAAAYATFNNYTQVGGIVLRTFFIDSTATDATHVAAIAHAHNVWNGSATPFYYTRQYSAPNAATVFHTQASSSGQYGYCARTFFFDSGLVDPTTANWAWARVDFDPSNFTNASRCGSQTDQHRGAITAHEWGHGVGLAHAGSSTLMSSTISGSSVTAPTSDDENGVNYLY